MVEQVAKNIYRIGVPLPKNPLKELNSYFIRGDESDLLIDTGFRCDECREALEHGLAELGSDPARRDVLLTHLHSDHSGMADLFAGPGRRIYMSETDLAYMKRFLAGETETLRRARFTSEGFTTEMIDEIYAKNPAVQLSIKEITDAYHGFKDGDTFTVGEYTLKALIAPGHTPGNSMFWIEEQGIMFSGDHILFDITPNITEWANVEDSLGDYIESLKRVKGYDVKLTLPGHRAEGDYSKRIDELLLHHEARIAEAFGIVKNTPGMTAYEIASKMTWRIRASCWEDFPIVQKRFAVGECISHLDYLVKRNKLTRELLNGHWRYYAV